MAKSMAATKEKKAAAPKKAVKPKASPKAAKKGGYKNKSLST